MRPLLKRVKQTTAYQASVARSLRSVEAAVLLRDLVWSGWDPTQPVSLEPGWAWDSLGMDDEQAERALEVLKSLGVVKEDFDDCCGRRFIWVELDVVLPPDPLEAA